ncbi:hypothetical protein [Bacillus cytotoxicus]|uniref:hypothetical protein n=3 Tax=Bacillus TaxID=1386 RepID=UPI001EF494EE|nr:hypothetical protein [Bacillus cytotoxicus]
MDVHYRSKHWQQMKDGINEITKDAITNLRQADELLEDIQERIQDLDSDRCIDFYHRKQEKKINTLLEDYTTLQNYCDKAGQVVYEHIDEPFYKKMDEFAQKMRDISIRDFQTKNRMGATTTTTLPSSHAYGVPQTITTKKEKITVDDIFKDSLAFDHVLRAQYKEVKKQNPDAKLNYKEYRQLVPSMRGFEYTSIEDEQKKLEAWRDVAISGALIITTIFCPPLGIAASVVYGGLQVKSAIEGEDWGTRRKLSKEEQVEAGFFGALDLIPGLGSATKAFKGTLDLGSLAKLTKWKEGIADFHPNMGKNVVQSLKENETLKNALHTWKKTKVPVAIRSADTGMGIKIPHIEHATVGEIAENFARVRATAKEDAYQLAKGNGGSGVKGTGKNLLASNGRFIDSNLESDYGKYLARKAKEGKTTRDRIEWKEARDYWLNDSPMARGNKFNKTVRNRDIYDYHEIHLENGKRLDSYDPFAKEIISRKATDLDMIDEKTYREYLKEMNKKYSAGTKIRSNAYPELDGKPLEGKQILEIPATNKNITDIEKYKEIAKEYRIELRFMGE